MLLYYIHNQKRMFGGNVMEIHWANGQYREDNRIFDSQFEVYEWTDSLYQDSQIALLEKKWTAIG